MSILIIEGCDLSGKTTAIERIAKFYNRGIIIKNSFRPHIPNDSAIYLQYWSILKLADKYNDLIILDRFYPSQAVYSILRGEDEMNHIDIDELENYCIQREDVFLILLDVSEEELKARYDKRGDEHVNYAQILQMRNRYRQFFKDSNLRKLKIDTTNKGWLEKMHYDLVDMGCNL